MTGIILSRSKLVRTFPVPVTFTARLALRKVSRDRILHISLIKVKILGNEHGSHQLGPCAKVVIERLRDSIEYCRIGRCDGDQKGSLAVHCG